MIYEYSPLQLSTLATPLGGVSKGPAVRSSETSLAKLAEIISGFSKAVGTIFKYIT